MSIIVAITAACHAYAAKCNADIARMKREERTELDTIEDEIDQLADIGDAASKVRILRLKGRLERKSESVGTLRPTDSDTDPPKAIPVQRGDIDGQGAEVSQ